MAARVTAAAVQVQVGGRTVMRFRGEPLPEGVATEVVERLVRKGLVEEVKETPRRGRKSADEKPAAEAAADEPAGDEPAGEK